MTIGFALSLALAAFVAWSLLAPCFVDAGSAAAETPPGGGALDSLGDQKSRCLQVMRDLELDYATGKIAPVDYEQTKARLTVELASILERIDAIGPK